MIETKLFNEESYYNFIDLNRGNLNVLYLKEELEGMGYFTTLPKVVKTNFKRADFPKISDLNNIRENLNTVVNIVPYLDLSIALKTDRRQTFDFNDANNIELSIKAVYDLIILAKQSFKYSGQFSAGDEIIL